MISEKLEKAFNEQINKEIYSAYLYLSMSAYLSDIGLNGFANWMKIQYQEETAHAMGLYDYLLENGIDESRIITIALDDDQFEAYRDQASILDFPSAKQIHFRRVQQASGTRTQ